jgi:hypothetical protein
MITTTISNKAFKSSAAIITVRKARRHSTDKVFWWMWENRLKEQMEDSGRMMERYLTLKNKVFHG